ncbi:bpX6 domain-containing protein [Parachitinimonas caeni]|uniref:BpX6 domain-containing protein n=1 Tax=Parachitinimonas caeni TaxID=3031301 RepID=A0ABT7DTN8_9NEIS|nr:bpX6 domain-containing protein [Parachitinimonas caeni]MDK2123439.1 bpX6 domain-containing protein [Parachitinimonas caeni]
MKLPPVAAVSRPCLTGLQSIAGIWLPAEWFGAQERATRLLSVWQSKARAYRFPAGDLLIFHEARSLQCEALPGWPLRRYDRTLASAELSANERKAAPAADVWLITAGQIEALRLADAEPILPGLWVDLDAYPLMECVDASELVRLPEMDLDLDGKSLGEVLGDGLPQASDRKQQFLEKLARDRQRSGNRTESASSKPGLLAGTGVADILRVLKIMAFLVGCVMLTVYLAEGMRSQPDPPLEPGASSLPQGTMPLTPPTAELPIPPAPENAGAGWALLLVAVLVWVWFAHVLRRSKARGEPPMLKYSTQPGGASQASSSAQSRIPPRRSHASPPRQRWRDWMVQAIKASGLANLLANYHVRYMREMLQMFEDGDLEKALRHAVPLGESQPMSGQALGNPQARKDLSLSRVSGAGGAGYNFGEEFSQHLAATYRRAFEKLDREGRVDEAVFVLAELLQSRSEALDYLERKERVKQAAELALAWDMPVHTIVRLHCLADDWRTAIAVARRDNAFEAAVSLLATKWPDASRRLRVEWAQSLADRGQWLEAVDTLWPVEQERNLAIRWLESAEKAEGQLAARALVQRACLVPATLQTHVERIARLRNDPEAYAERTALALALIELKAPNTACRRLAKAILPALMVDIAQTRASFHRQQLYVLIQLSGDELLKADLPRQPFPEASRPQALASRKDTAHWQAPPAGNQAILDAAVLADGQFLLALGEAGLVRVDEQGKITARFATPATHIVAAHSGMLALALIKRDQIWRVSRIDIANLHITDLGVMQLDHFATSYDGIGWTVAVGNRLCVLDSTRSLRDVLWQVTDLPGPVISLQTNRQFEVMAVGKPGGFEAWQYRLEDSRRLVGRDQYDYGGGNDFWMIDASDGVLGVSNKVKPNKVELTLQYPHRHIGIALDGVVTSSAAVKLTKDRQLLACVFDEPSLVTRTFFLTHGRSGPCGVLEWPYDAPASTRAMDGDWVIFDCEGRLWHMNAATSMVRSISLRL